MDLDVDNGAALHREAIEMSADYDATTGRVLLRVEDETLRPSRRTFEKLLRNIQHFLGPLRLRR
jgi:hypothetical protein